MYTGIMVICLLIGYGCGLFPTGLIVGKVNGIDVRKHGSGNVGMTNAMRTIGFKAGVITFAGDAGKTIAAMLIAWLLFRGYADMRVYMLAAALGAVCGHNFPFFLKFKGGKGIACTAGVVMGFYPPFMIISFGLFAVAALATKYVSLGSLLLVSSFYVQLVICGQLGVFDLDMNGKAALYILGAVFVALAFLRHKDNIKRLVSGTENKFSLHK